MKVAVFGASGFVGTALVEKLRGCAGVETHAFINRVGSAWRLSRACIPMTSVDITSASDVDEALKGCTHVVNCTRGSTKVMLQGLRNLLDKSRANGIRRFVHLSSNAVYGNPPPPESEREDAPARPALGSYGWEKLKQDEMVAAAASHLDCVVLCPPNISGLYSSFVGNVLRDIRNGHFALVEGGCYPLSVVDVENLTHAMLLALRIPKGDGKRIFINDGVGLTWKDLADALLPIADAGAPVATILASEAAEPVVSNRPLVSLWRSLKHLVSSDVREAVRRDPLWSRADVWTRNLVALAGVAAEDRLRHAIEGPQRVKKMSDPNPFPSRYNAMQLRGIWHRIDRAREVLGYEPQITFAESMKRYRAWYAPMHGFDKPFWPLARTLEAF